LTGDNDMFCSGIRLLDTIFRSGPPARGGPEVLNALDQGI
jgi:hypothetical protein